ncbi:zinc-activated ligand-gated ion channel [Python bivittatus]|uniref:Zinc-activated ligand-gated ion channel n=1 Tax=Python bivittatus TaxID=176946 RepID=A0A9F5J5H2_PYTBI|nr:zinc-activated ligand-gated ion channel [Python bivittatus]
MPMVVKRLCSGHQPVQTTESCTRPWLLAAQAASLRITWQNSSASLEEKLFESLLDANALCPTYRNGNGPLLVNINVRMSNVLNVDILKYTITSVLVLNQSWYNERLVWDEVEFPFSTITVPWSSVWTPSYIIEEAFDVTWRVESPNVVLHSDGKTEFQLALRIDSNCNFDLFYYPLDSSQCFLSFFSLANKVSDMEFKVSIRNEILNLKREYLVASANITSQRNMPQPYFVVMINLKNTGIRAILSLVVPSIAVVVADLCGFFIPLQDRLSYMVTLLLAYLVFYSSFIDSLPGSSSCNPLLSYYYTGLLILLFLSTIETILVLKLVTDNANLGLNYGFKTKKKATSTVSNDQSYQSEDAKDPKTKGLWYLWKCAPEKPPGENHLDGIKWTQGE